MFRLYKKYINGDEDLAKKQVAGKGLLITDEPKNQTGNVFKKQTSKPKEVGANVGVVSSGKTNVTAGRSLVDFFDARDFLLDPPIEAKFSQSLTNMRRRDLNVGENGNLLIDYDNLFKFKLH